MSPWPGGHLQPQDKPGSAPALCYTMGCLDVPGAQSYAPDDAPASSSSALAAE